MNVRDLLRVQMLLLHVEVPIPVQVVHAVAVAHLMIVIVPVLLPAGLMEHLRIVAAVLLLPTIVEVRQLHVAIRRQVVVAVLLQVLLILRAVPLQAPAIHRVNLLLGRVVTQAVVEVVVPVPVQVHPVVEAVVEEDKIVVFIKKTYL